MFFFGGGYVKQGEGLSGKEGVNVNESRGREATGLGTKPTN